MSGAGASLSESLLKEEAYGHIRQKLNKNVSNPTPISKLKLARSEALNEEEERLHHQLESAYKKREESKSTLAKRSMDAQKACKGPMKRIMTKAV